MSNRVGFTVAGLGLLLGSGPALAQMEEIVVEATRRERNLQEVPLAVSAFSLEQINNLQIETVQDIGDAVPNLQTYQVTAGTQALQLHARGASVQNPGFNVSESPVGFYEDDVYRGRLASVNLALSDVERIEVLRGPQATLYGRNTIAGAVKIVTRTPGDERWANLSLGYGNFETSQILASIGGPIEEGALAGSLAVAYRDRGKGWQDNPVLGTEPGEYTDKIARGKLRWYGTDGFEATLTAFAVDVENDGYNGVPYQPFTNAGPPPTPVDNRPAPPGGPLGDFYDNFSSAGANFGRSDQGGLTLDWTWDISTEVQLRSISAYVQIEDQFGFDLAGGGFLGNPGTDGLVVASDSVLDQFSQEFQLLGTSLGGRLDWIAGFFYLNEDGDQTYEGALPLFGLAFNERTFSETDSYALFGEATWRFAERWAVTAGLRWTEDQKDYRITCTGGCQFEPGEGPSLSREADFDEVTAKLGVDYTLGEDTLLYASWSQGFQAGGFRTLCFGNLTNNCAGGFFDPQTVDSFELGYKGDLFDNRLRVNLIAFYAMYDDIQNITILPSPFGASFPINNIGEVDVYGLELEAYWMPIDNLNVFLVAGLQESDFGDVDPASPAGGFSGLAPAVDELPSNPGYSGRAGFDYTWPLGGDVDLSFGANVVFTDDYFTEARNLVPIDSFTRLNGFVAVGHPDGRWQLRLSGTNITDEEDNVSGIFAAGFANIRTPLPPAEYLLELKLNY